MSDVVPPPQAPCYPDLKGKSALVTGGGSGIGRGICLRLGAEGMCVFLCGRTEKTIQETAELVRAEEARPCPSSQTCLDLEQIERLFKQLYVVCKSLDLLVHNAAKKGGGPLGRTLTWTCGGRSWRPTSTAPFF